MQPDFDLAILGAGPGGYVAAIRAAQLGLKTCLVEKDKPGGVCLNWGCIPSKALIHQADLLRGIPDLQALGVAVDAAGLDYAQAHRKSRQAAERLSTGVQFLLKKNAVEVIQGEGRLASPAELVVDGERRIRARAILLATGSRPRELPGLPFDETTVLSSTGALDLKRLPKTVAILGAGAIGMEMGYVWNAFGADVTLIEAMDRILPLEDAEAAALARRIFEKRGVKFIAGAFAAAGARGSKGLGLDLRPAQEGAAGIPARVGFADVRNHLTSPRFSAMMDDPDFRWHAYTALNSDGQWLKATPAFDRAMCEKQGVAVLTFDGRTDSIFQPFDASGRKAMEYIAFHGEFDDLPFDLFTTEMRRIYPRLLVGVAEVRAARAAGQHRRLGA